MKGLLVVARFYPPGAGGGVYRTLGFVRHLPEHGWRPVVLTGPAEAAWVEDPGLLEGVRDVETLRAGGAGPASLGRGPRRPAWVSALAGASAWLTVPDAHVSWRAPAARAGLERLRQGGVDAIYSTSPPDTGHLVALDLKRATGLPWVADFRDPWIGLGYREPPTPWHRARHERLLREVLRGADTLLAATEGTRRFLAQHEPSAAAKCVVVPNGFEAEEWRDVTPERFPHFTVVHAGRLSGDRGLGDFLDGLDEFFRRDASRRARTRCLMVGPHDAAEPRRVEARGFADVVSFPGQVPHRQALALEAGAHALLLVKHTSPRFGELIPGKLYEYLGSGRPVLAVVPEGPAAELVRGLGMGWVAPPGDPARLADALEAAWEGRVPARGLAEERAAFTRGALTARLAAALERLA